jgi:hypothetical protein
VFFNRGNNMGEMTRGGGGGERERETYRKRERRSRLTVRVEKSVYVKAVKLMRMLKRTYIEARLRAHKAPAPEHSSVSQAQGRSNCMYVCVEYQ